MDASISFKEAIERGDIHAVTSSIDQGVNLNERFTSWTEIYFDGGTFSFPASPLEHAVIHDQAEVVDILIAHGADINLKGGYEPALHQAVHKGNVEMVRKLIQAGADVNMPTGGHFPNAIETDFGYGSSGWESSSVAERREEAIRAPGEMRWRDTTALSKAIRGNETEIIRLLIANGATLYPQCIYDAVESGNLDIVRLVLSQQSASLIDINAVAGRLGRPLQAAAMRDGSTEELFSLLLDRGADIYAKGGGSPQPIAAIVAKGLVDILAMVIDRGLVRDDAAIALLPAKFTILHIAVCFRNRAILELLLKSRVKASVSSQDAFGRTPLHLAALSFEAAFRAANDALSDSNLFEFEMPPESLRWPDGDPSIAKYLVDQGARGDILDFSGTTALEICLRFTSPEFAREVFIASPNHNITGHKWKNLLTDLTQKDKYRVEYNHMKFTAQAFEFTQSRLSCDGNAVWQSSKAFHKWWMMIKLSKEEIMPKNDDLVSAIPKDDEQALKLERDTNALESINFITTSDYTPGRIPRAAVFLFVPLVLAVRDEWTKTFQTASQRQKTMRSRILLTKGSDPRVIDTLLQDALVWVRLEAAVQEQLRNFHELQAGYKADPLSKNSRTALHERFHDEDEMTRFNEALESVTKFLNKELDMIKTTSRELIELEFNLTSIREAQKSTSTSLSMKRLSWITFIYLPLTFVASLFGMNIDVLKSNPPWWTYLPFAVVTLGLTIIVWSIFKYTLDENRQTEREGSLTTKANWTRVLALVKKSNSGDGEKDDV
ncbi:hypothetical protein MFIFM68171_08116 [Madurella fahalii]|uniref:Ankyrin repeat protein n=1 Tax=Madurella fahalii TaxID=1157608 RepID=A0ABQ0GJI9_9PEZI